MPGSVQNAVPMGVMPASLCTAFVESREYTALVNQYHDGTVERSLLAQTSRRTFKLSKRLDATALAALKAFWDAQDGGLAAFVFYNPVDVTPGNAIGSNYDPEGNSTVGRVTVVFRGNWSQSTGLARTDVPNIELIEVA